MKKINILLLLCLIGFIFILMWFSAPYLSECMETVSASADVKEKNKTKPYTNISPGALL